MDYKETLHMPKTAFEMRGNLTKKEPGFQKRWQDEKLYEKMLERRKGAESFVLHDGPPYANGDIHLGHALNKVLKDVILKSHFMEGYNTPYIPGWDTHGLPIETAVTKLGYDRKKMGIAEFRKMPTPTSFFTNLMIIHTSHFKRILKNTRLKSLEIWP